MKHFPSLVLLCSYFLLSAFLGLNTAWYVYPLMYPPAGVEPVMEPIVGNPQEASSALWIFAYIIAVTAVMLLLMRLGWGFVIRGALVLSFFSGSFFCLSAMFGDLTGLLLAFVLLCVMVWKGQNAIVSNTALTFTLAGVGSILGLSLGMVPAFVLIVVISAYDFVAVYVTKHMVTLARESKGRFSMMFLAPVGDRMMGLGAGDIALPTAFVVSVFAAHGIGYAVPTAFGGLIGLVSVFYYLLDREGATLPAMPPIAMGLLIGYGTCLLILH